MDSGRCCPAPSYTSCPLWPQTCSSGPPLPSRVTAQALAFHQVAPVGPPAPHIQPCLKHKTTYLKMSAVTPPHMIALQLS